MNAVCDNKRWLRCGWACCFNAIVLSPHLSNCILVISCLGRRRPLVFVSFSFSVFFSLRFRCATADFLLNKEAQRKQCACRCFALFSAWNWKKPNKQGEKLHCSSDVRLERMRSDFLHFSLVPAHVKVTTSWAEKYLPRSQDGLVTTNRQKMISYFCSRTATDGRTRFFVRKELLICCEQWTLFPVCHFLHFTVHSF